MSLLCFFTQTAERTKSNPTTTLREIGAESVGTNPEQLALCCQCYLKMRRRICERHEDPHLMCFECLLISGDLKLELEIKREEGGDRKSVCRERKSRESGWEYGSYVSDGDQVSEVGTER